MSMMRKTEHPHNSSAQVRGYIKEALALVAELDPPAKLAPLVFGKAVDLLAAKQIVMEPLAVHGMQIPQGRI